MEEVFLQYGPLGGAVVILIAWVGRIQHRTDKLQQELSDVSGQTMTRAEFKADLRSYKEDEVRLQKAQHHMLVEQMNQVRSALERMDRRLDNLVE